MKDDNYPDDVPVPIEYVSLLAHAREGQIAALIEEVRLRLHDMPRWRWLGRARFERILLLARLVHSAYLLGMQAARPSNRGPEVPPDQKPN